VFALSVITLLRVVLFFLAFQRFLLEGVSASERKD
jgi:ABC-type glycerol-3-phosphate transport system permease component